MIGYLKVICLSEDFKLESNKVAACELNLWDAFAISGLALMQRPALSNILELSCCRGWRCVVTHNVAAMTVVSGIPANILKRVSTEMEV